MANTPIDTAISAAKEAGALLKEHVGRAGRIEFKGAVDIVTEMDKRAESLIIARIKTDFPGHGILTEESEEIKGDAAGRRWIIDPLDGTTNYAHGFPVFAVSVAYEEDGVVLCGAVYNPMLNELFTVEKGKGAWLNGEKIRVSRVDKLDRALLATGFPYDMRTSEFNNVDHFTNFSVRAQAIRRAGSASLDLSYLACGRFDGFWELKLKPWDTAAAALLVKEAGGALSDFRGREFSIYRPECLASNGLVHVEMLDVLRMGKSALDKK